MNANKIAHASIGVALFSIGYYLSIPSIIPHGLNYSVYHALASLRMSLIFPLQNIVPSMLLLGGLGILLRFIIKSKWIILGVLLVLGYLLTKSIGILPIGYFMFGETRYFYLAGLAFFLWAILEIDDSVRNRAS